MKTVSYKRKLKKQPLLFLKDNLVLKAERKLPSFYNYMRSRLTAVMRLSENMF